MKAPHLIVGGNLNFILGRLEVWGPNSRSNPLVEFFLMKLRDGKLFDPNLIKIAPTWRNNRVGESKIAKILNRFFLSDDFAIRIKYFVRGLE